VIDLVLNHTSSQHPWFVDATSNPDSPYRDYYIWAEEHPGYEGPFGPAWHEKNGEFYYGVFWSEMPDLNLENTAVTAELQEITRFWLEEVGVDGFRLDAIKHLIENGPIQENTPATHAWLQEYYQFYKSVNPDAMTVGEVWSTTDDVVPYIADDEVDLAFDFDLANGILDSAVSGRKVNVERAQGQVVAHYPFQQFATFLANHDQNRTRSRVLNDEQAKIAASLQLLFGGVPFIYYGEEIGQQGTKPDENIRRPMQWDETGGFSVDETATPWNAYYEDYATRHVAGQTADPDSLLNHYRRLIRLRLAETALRQGAWELVDSGEARSVYSFVRRTEEDTLLVLLNLGRDEIGTDGYTLSLDNLGLTEATAVELLQNAPVTPPTLTSNGGFTNYSPLTLPAYSTFVIRLR
jgi:alpha-amylase